MTYTEHKRSIQRIYEAWSANTHIVEVRKDGRLSEVRRVCSECGK